MGTRRSVLALWLTLVFAGSLLALIARGAGPLPGDLTLTRLLQEWLPPDGLVGSLLGYAGRIVWFVPAQTLFRFPDADTVMVRWTMQQDEFERFGLVARPRARLTIWRWR